MGKLRLAITTPLQLEGVDRLEVTRMDVDFRARAFTVHYELIDSGKRRMQRSARFHEDTLQPLNQLVGGGPGRFERTIIEALQQWLAAPADAVVVEDPE